MRKIEKCVRCVDLDDCHNALKKMPRYMHNGLLVTGCKIYISLIITQPCTCDMHYKPYREGSISVIDEAKLTIETGDLKGVQIPVRLTADGYRVIECPQGGWSLTI